MVTDKFYRYWRNFTTTEIGDLSSLQKLRYSYDIKRSRNLWKNYFDRIPSEIKSSISESSKGFESVTAPKVIPVGLTQEPSLRTFQSAPSSQISEPSLNLETKGKVFIEPSITSIIYKKGFVKEIPLSMEEQRYVGRIFRKEVIESSALKVHPRYQELKAISDEGRVIMDKWSSELAKSGIPKEQTKKVDVVYAYTKRQHCWVHKLRNVAKYLKKSDEKEVLAQAKEIYKAETKRQAVRIFKCWKNRWYRKYPQAVNCIEKDMDELLNFLEIPIKEQYRKLIRRRIRTTNVIERAFREVRKRTRPMSCFTNQDSVNRIIYAILTRLNNKWKDKPLKEFTQFI